MLGNVRQFAGYLCVGSKPVEGHDVRQVKPKRDSQERLAFMILATLARGADVAGF